MQVIVNGTPETIEESATVSRLLERHNLAKAPCAVEVNKSIVPRKSHADHHLRDGDRVEIVTLVGGG
ncbi:MAG: sulfur carrier protein ThiS [Phycisphaeraceae bacterium]|nr:sulfur carrier protein ThiS [Phycisphaerales bacterium]MCB9842459.1 sulfur carrier protein ThiS [Phycisphaeraceae bacterium]